MKLLLNKSMWVAVAFISVGPVAANAAQCPAAPFDEGKAFVLTTDPTDAACWDYGNDNVSGDNGTQYVTLAPDWDTLEERVGTPGANTDAAENLQLPDNVALIGNLPNLASGAGPAVSNGYLTLTKLTDSSGTWSVSGGIIGDFYLLLKSGSALDPVWAAFKIPAGETSGSWSIIGDRGLGLSHASLYGEVPLPAAAWLLLSGLVGLVGISRRRRSVA